MITEQSAELLELYGHYKNGTLCFGGGAYDQPKKYLDAMKIINKQVNSE